MSIFFAAPVEQYPKDLATSNVPTATNTNASFPASNLVTMDPTQVFKTSASSSVITWDLGSQREFDVFSMIHSSLSYKALWVIETSTDNTTFTTRLASSPFSSHLTSVPGSWANEAADPRRPILNRNKSMYINPTVITARYIRITVTGDVTLDPTFSIGRLFIGKKFVPSTGWQYGSSFIFQDSSAKERTTRGALVTDITDVIVSASVKTEFLSKAEMYDSVYEFNYWRGASREFLACLDVEDIVRLQKNLLYCTISEGRTISFDAFNAHSQTWILESIA